MHALHALLNFMRNDPRSFSCVIMTLYACNVIRWAFAKNLGQACYWTSAFAITFTVTFLMEKH
jgi:hypothetical protein